MPGERTEQATQHRREQARKEGDILHSRELSAAAGTLAGIIALGVMGSHSLLAWRTAFAGFLSLGMPQNWEPDTIQPTLAALRGLSMSVLWPVALVMAVVAGAVLLVGVLQTGGISFYAGAVGFKPNRINPVSNIKNLFSLRAAARLGKSLIPASLLAVFAVQRIGRQLTLPPFSTTRLEMLASDVFGLLQAAAWLLFAWAAVDYLVEWQSRESRLKMSREDMRDEAKQTEGNPADSQPYSRPAASDAPPPGQGRCEQGRGGADQSNPLCRGPGLRLRHHGSAPRCWPKGATCWPRRSRPRPDGRECRSSRTRRWPARSISRSKWGRRFPSIFMPRSPPFWPISIASGWRASYANGVPGKTQHAPRQPDEQAPAGPAPDPTPFGRVRAVPIPRGRLP